jgi:hypothetical protein
MPNVIGFDPVSAYTWEARGLRHGLRLGFTCVQCPQIRKNSVFWLQSKSTYVRNVEFQLIIDVEYNDVIKITI